MNSALVPIPHPEFMSRIRLVVAGTWFFSMASIWIGATGFLVLRPDRAAATTIVEARITASSDDAEQFASGSMYLNSSDLELIHDADDQTVGMRWVNLAIPRGATISAAYIQFVAKESQSEITTLTFRAQASDNAPTFSGTSLNISSRTKTTASQGWSPVAWNSGDGGANQRTPDLSTLIQEVVNRSGWASGNALAVIVTGVGHRTAWAWDGSPTEAPLLHVEYSGTPGDPSAQGSWSSVYPWPNVGIHLHVLPDGKVLTFADDDNPNYPINGARLAGSTKTFVVDIPIGGAPDAVVSIPNDRTNMFCSGHAFLADGRLLVIGGHLGRDGWGEPETNLFSWKDSYTWSAGDDMHEGRWYPSGCVLANGDMLAISGTMDTLAWAAIPEIWSPNGGWRQLTNANLTLPYYPFTFLAPNGYVFCAGPGRVTYYLDTDGLGAWTFVANHVSSYNRSYSSAVQYGDGKILVVGGADPPTNTCEIIDLNQPSPIWQSTGAMQYSRRMQNATILPDGTVLATGGTSAAGFNDNSGAVFTAELWNPTTGSWTTMASMAVPRLYHSTAALLPDGRVLATGGGRPKATNGGIDHLDAEIFSPPYLYKGTRPTITTAPSLTSHGASITIDTPDAAGITRVTLVGLTTTTHAFNMGQRFSALTFSNVGGGSLLATVPASPNLLPPGYYMLFIINGNGVPSIGRMIQILPPGSVAVEDPATRLLDFMSLRSANPIRGGEARIVFTLSHGEVGTVEVLDLTGRRVKVLAEDYFEAGEEHTVKWDRTDQSGARVPSGLYWYRLRTPTMTRTGKIAVLSR